MAVDVEYEQAIAKVEELMRKLDRAWDTLVKEVNTLLRLGGAATGRLRDEFNELNAKVDQLNREVAELFTERGSASAILAAAESWNLAVKNRITTQAGVLILGGSLVADNEWHGPAATAYGDAVRLQGEALTQVATTVDNLQNILNNLANAMKVFWTGMALTLGVGVAAVVGAAFGGLGPVIAAVAGCLAVVGKLAVDYRGTLDEGTQKLEQQLTNKPNGGWPPAVAENYTGDDDWRLT